MVPTPDETDETDAEPTARIESDIEESAIDYTHIDDGPPDPEAEGNPFRPVDDDYEYEEAAETHIGEPARAEIALESVDGTQVKRFKIAEPQDPSVMAELVNLWLDGQLLEACELIVEEPTLSKPHDEGTYWDEALTGREQAMLFDLCCQFVRLDDFVDRDAQAQLQAVLTEMTGG